MSKISIVISAYNESDKIASTLTQIISFLKDFSPEHEILIVNDGSTDNMADVVREYQKNAPQVVLLDNPHKGKGYGIWDGVMHAQGDYIYTADADMSAPIEELRKLLVWVQEHDYDIAIATREGVGAKRINEPIIRHLMGRIFNFWIQLVAVRGIQDTQCGFKLFTRKAAKDIFGRFIVYGANTPVTDKPYLGSWDVEALFIAHRLGYKVREVPVVWTYVKTTRLSHIRDSIKMSCDVLKIRINGLLGKYNSPAQKTSSIV